MPLRRDIADEELDITPMIDVTFLMLIFFMVTSTMQGTPDVPVPPARSGAGVNQSDAIIVTVLGGGDGAEPRVFLGDGPQAPEGAIEDVAAHVGEGVASQRSVVILKADRDVSAGFVEKVARAAQVEGVEQMFYGVQEP